MNVMARLRLVVARHRWLYWAAVTVLAISVGAVVASATGRVDTARRAWGESRDVAVASGDLVPGQPLAARIEVRALPAPMVPDAALEGVPSGAVARQHIAAGEIVVDADIAPSAAPRALIPDAWAAVAVAEGVPTGAAVGDRVLAVADGVVLAADAIVVGYQGDAALVAIPGADAPGVAMAAAAGVLSLLLVP